MRVDIREWYSDEDFPVFPSGSQPKTLLVCPEDTMRSPLIPGHRYLFKTPSGWQKNQIWSELVAYEFSNLVDVNVPRCFIGVDAKGQPGALIEFFHGYPQQLRRERFVHGSDLLQRFLIDKKRGRPHGIRTNVELTRRYGVSAASILWGKFLVFDALIGNTDRHPDNWGLIWTYQFGALPSVALAPAFDNGTSLGYEIREERIVDFTEGARADRYIAAGKHHCGWSQTDDQRSSHLTLCARFCSAYPTARDAMVSSIRFDERELARRVDHCVSIGAGLGMSPTRGQLMLDMIRRRRDGLARLFRV